MKDILLFGAGHEGTKRQIERGRDVFYAISQPAPASTSCSFVGYRSARVPFTVSTVYAEKGGFLIGVFGDEPSDEQIMQAIFKYEPEPVG